MAGLTTAAVATQLQSSLTSAGVDATVAVTSLTVQPVTIPGETTTLGGGGSGAKATGLALGALGLLCSMVM